MIIKIMNCNLKSIAFKNGTLMMSINISRKSFHTNIVSYKRTDILSVYMDSEKSIKSLEISKKKDKILTGKYIYNQKWIKTLEWNYTIPSKFNNKFITYDIESYYDSNGKVIPYLIGLYSPLFDFKSFYGENCVNDCIEFLLNYDYDGNKIKNIELYAHNGGQFDLLLIIKEILKYKISKINYIENNNGSIILFSFNYLDVKFNFKDSYALMPLSLSKLIKSFNIVVDGYKDKLNIDHSWVNKERLNYKGPKPSWIDENLEEFNFKEYIIKYNSIDTKGLYKVIEQFNLLIISELNIDVSKCLTLPQAAMKIFRTKYLNDSKKIKLFSNRTFDFVNNSYHGACVSVYKPYGKNLYYYDVNSLYPFVMLKDMPVGKPQHFDISKGLNELFGFAYASVECPKDMKIPVLPIKVRIADKETLIFPTGKFSGYWFSAELQYAESLGYKIELKRAIEFKKDNGLFVDYITDFYKLKSSSNTGIKTLSKLFLNTLYGRFGMHRNVTSNIIVNSDEERNKIEETFSNITATQLNENTTLYNYNITPNPNLFYDNPELAEKLNKNNIQFMENKISNIAIASAITSYARIEIDKYKRIEGINLYYSDTDSIVIDKPLPCKYIGSELGKMKNELADANYTLEKDSQYSIDEGIFIRDKVYSLKLQSGQIITKFSGLNKNYITPQLFEILKDVYIKNIKTINLDTTTTYKNKKTMEIIRKNTSKEFVFKYYKRIPVYENNIWIDTKPIDIISTKKDLLPLITKETVLSKTKNVIGVRKLIDKIDVTCIKPNYNKYYDGLFLNYSSNKLNSLKINRDYLLNELRKIFVIINKDKVLVNNIGYLITEEYLDDKLKIRMKTINYLTCYKSIESAINIYKDHLIELEESDIQSGNFLLNSKDNNLTKLWVKIRIPAEYKEKLFEIFKKSKLPRTEINLVVSNVSNSSIKLLPAPIKYIALPMPDKILALSRENPIRWGKINKDREISVLNHNNLIPLNKKYIRKYTTSKDSTNFKRINEIINEIKDTEKFKIALTHKSCKNNNSNINTYERLEFIGDSILEFYITFILYSIYPNKTEGELTILRSNLVCGKNLADISIKIGLDKYLKYDQSLNLNLDKDTKSKKGFKIFSDIFESFIAALYIEKGNNILIEFLCLTILNIPDIKDKFKILNELENKTNLINEKIKPKFDEIKNNSNDDFIREIIKILFKENKKSNIIIKSLKFYSKDMIPNIEQLCLTELKKLIKLYKKNINKQIELNNNLQQISSLIKYKVCISFYIIIILLLIIVYLLSKIYNLFPL